MQRTSYILHIVPHVLRTVPHLYCQWPTIPALACPQGAGGVPTNELLYYNAITSLPLLLVIVWGTGEGTAALPLYLSGQGGHVRGHACVCVCVCMRGHGPMLVHVCSGSHMYLCVCVCMCTYRAAMLLSGCTHSISHFPPFKA